MMGGGVSPPSPITCHPSPITYHLHRDATDPPHSRPHPSQLLFELTPQLDPTGRQGRSERESRTAEDHRAAAREVGHRHRLHPHIPELSAASVDAQRYFVAGLHLLHLAIQSRCL